MFCVSILNFSLLHFWLKWTIRRECLSVYFFLFIYICCENYGNVRVCVHQYLPAHINQFWSFHLIFVRIHSLNGFFFVFCCLLLNCYFWFTSRILVARKILYILFLFLFVFHWLTADLRMQYANDNASIIKRKWLFVLCIVAW